MLDDIERRLARLEWSAQFPPEPVHAGRLLIAFCIGIVATLAWQSYGGAVREMIANSSPRLRVRLRALSRIAELSQHEADGRKFQKREGVAVEIFPILGETTAPVEPSDRAFDDPTLGQSHESFGVIGSSDDFGFEMRQGFGERVRKNRALIGAVGKQLLEEWKLTEQRGQQQDAAIAILDAGGMHDGVQQ
jgi:hypothetical protein